MRLLFVACLYFSYSFAYLDPGSGSLLLSSIVAIFASVVFFIKNLFYKFASPSTLLSGGFSFSALLGGGGYTHLKASIVFYSEGKQYYFTFKPILDALDSLKHPYIYYTSGLDDPALERTSKSDNCGTFTYIGTGNKAYVKLNTLRADICVLTTPGLEVLQIKRSRGVKHYCHIVHSLTPMTYRAFGLDYFDSVLVANEIQRDFVREVEVAHDVKHKYIGVVGSTYLDELASLRNSSLGNHSADSQGTVITDKVTPTPKPCENHESNTTNARIYKSSGLDSINRTESSEVIESQICTKEPQGHTLSVVPEDKCEQSVIYCSKLNLPATILVSPSWGKETLLNKYGLELLEPLARSGFRIIIRPHPQSLIGEMESKNIQNLQESLKGYENIEWDIGTPNVYAFARADVMISDFSSVIFDFICLEGKPVLTLDFDFDTAGYDLADIDIGHFYTFEALKRIGGKLQEQDFAEISTIIKKLLDSYKMQKITQCKEELWRYPHKAGLRAVNELLKIERELLEHSIKAYMLQVHRIRELDSMIKDSSLGNHLRDWANLRAVTTDEMAPTYKLAQSTQSTTANTRILDSKNSTDSRNSDSSHNKSSALDSAKSLDSKMRANTKSKASKRTSK